MERKRYNKFGVFIKNEKEMVAQTAKMMANDTHFRQDSPKTPSKQVCSKKRDSKAIPESRLFGSNPLLY